MMSSAVSEITVISNPQKTVLEQILEWSQERSMWQRNALRRILQENEINNQDIDDLVQCLKLEKSGDIENLIENLTVTPLEKSDLPANPQAAEAVTIDKLANVAHVNNLASNQELQFSSNGITVIYGGNGSGKSGYTRILKSSCRARHRDRILTNVFVSEYKGKTPTADISYSTTSIKFAL